MPTTTPMTTTMTTAPSTALAPDQEFPILSVWGREYRWNTHLQCLEIKRAAEGYWDRSAFNGFLHELLFEGAELATYALRPEFPQIRALYIAFSHREDAA